MKKIDTYSRVDRQFKVLKKISKRIAFRLSIDVEEVEKFILSREFFKALEYSRNLHLFIADFKAFQEDKMGVDSENSREYDLLRSIFRGRYD